MQDLTELHFADLQLQRFARDAQKLVGRIGQRYFEIAGIFRRRAERLSI